MQFNIHAQNEQVIVKPNSPPLPEAILAKRPASTKGPTAAIKPQSPPLQVQNFNPNGSGQQFYAQKGDPYMAHL